MNEQQVLSMSITRKVVIFSGGTMVHVRPHFSLCAPAYGKVGDTLEQEFKNLQALAKVFSPQANYFTIRHHKTKMAGGDEVETNEDLAKKLDEVLADPSVSAIIMAAAICDFEPSCITEHTNAQSRVGHEEYSNTFGKEYPRLDSKQRPSLQLMASEKLIDKIKQKRPDIFLATFKTTSDETEEYLQYRATENLERCGSDIVLGNDIKNKYNILVTGKSCTSFEERKQCLQTLAVQTTQGMFKLKE